MKKLFLTLGLVVSLLVLGTSTALAYNPYNGVDCTKSPNNKADSSAICNAGNKNPLSGPDGAIADITNIVSYVAGGIAVIVVIVGSLRYITSGGDPGAVKKAKDSVLYALIGIAVIVLARIIILFVVTKLA